MLQISQLECNTLVASTTALPSIELHFLETTFPAISQQGNLQSKFFFEKLSLMHFTHTQPNIQFCPFYLLNMLYDTSHVEFQCTIKCCFRFRLQMWLLLVLLLLLHLNLTTDGCTYATSNKRCLQRDRKLYQNRKLTQARSAIPPTHVNMFEYTYVRIPILPYYDIRLCRGIQRCRITGISLLKQVKT